MKTLALLRHAKSSWDDQKLADFDRPLNDRGRKAAALMGAELRRRGLTFDLAIASPAQRVTETLDIVQKGLGAPLNVRWEPAVYESTPATLLDLIKATDDRIESLLLVGHNPTMQALALMLARKDDPARERIAEGYPTAALLLIEFPAENWNSVQPGSGRIRAFLKPRELEAAP
jgi:phosphohistidine phosphatase